MMTNGLYSNQQVWFTTRQVATRFGVSVATLWRWIAAGKFPKPVMITDRASRWPEAVLTDFEQNAMNRKHAQDKGKRRAG